MPVPWGWGILVPGGHMSAPEAGHMMSEEQFTARYSNCQTFRHLTPVLRFI